jgi:hypothetical protein
MSAPTFTSWNQSARDKTSRIFSAPHKSNYALINIRQVIDAMIALFWDVSPDVTTVRDQVESSNLRREHWQYMGSKAVAYAQELNIINGAQPELEAGALAALLCRKQHDYGHENIARFGFQGLLVRVHDKVARLENLVNSDKSPENESIKDNLLDVIGYCAIGMMLEEGTFLLNLEATTVVEEK